MCGNDREREGGDVWEICKTKQPLYARYGMEGRKISLRLEHLSH